MEKTHIAVPRFILKNFSVDSKTLYYDWRSNRLDTENIKILGTEIDYYPKHVEKDILAKIEHRFSLFLNEYIKANNSQSIIKLVSKFKNDITKFLNMMYFRSKEAINQTNNWSLISKTLNPLEHFELIEIQNIVSINFLDFVGNNFQIYPIINFTNISFINNSIGFSMVKNKENKIDLFYPLTTTKGLYVTQNKDLSNPLYKIEEPTIVKTLNKYCSFTEVTFGNGFIFGNSGFLLLDNVDHLDKAIKELQRKK